MKFWSRTTSLVPTFAFEVLTCNKSKKNLRKAHLFLIIKGQNFSQHPDYIFFKIKVDVELATIDGEANFDDSYTVKFSLTSTDDATFVFAEWQAIVDIKDRPVSPSGFPGDLVETTFKRNFSIADGTPEVKSGFDYQFEVDGKIFVNKYLLCLKIKS